MGCCTIYPLRSQEYSILVVAFMPNHDPTMQHNHSAILVRVNFLNLLEQLVNLLKAQPILAAREQKGQKLVAMIFVVPIEVRATYLSSLHQGCQLTFGGLGQRISDFKTQHLFFIVGRTTTDRTSMTDCALTIPRLQDPIPARVNPTVGLCQCWLQNLLRLDARHPYRDGAGHDPLLPGNKPLALF
jgi:hypothetical protein